MNPAPRNSKTIYAATSFACPACQTVIATPDRCPNCRFTGADTMAMFPGPPPLLETVIDEGEILDERDLRIIRRALVRTRCRFPQIHWRICSTALPPDANLRLFGFWLLNACPLAADETAADRAWTVLLVIDGSEEKVAVVPAYAAEVWLSTDQWEKALASMTYPWKSGHPGKAVATFLNTASDLLEGAWQALDAPPTA